MSDGRALIECRDMSAGYRGRAVVSGISFSVREGETVALVGENGSGKSTLLKTLIKEIPPVAGSVFIDGMDTARLSAGDIARKLAIVMTSGVRPEYFTCFDMVSSGRYPYTDMLGRLKDEDREAVEEAMLLTGTWELRDRYVSDISDGQRQLVMLSRAIAQEPEILILDEPASFLDIRHRLLFARAVEDLVNERGISVLMSMHELELVRSMADRVISLKDGRMDRDGKTKEIFTDEYIRELFRLE
ncbi:MAG: ABC transporter ATP-binding protein [Lachnospiraceae bacterium]|nr:ABC transporter ATP-binding protein [Lachnospiraceae bacterium]